MKLPPLASGQYSRRVGLPPVSHTLSFLYSVLAANILASMSAVSAAAWDSPADEDGTRRHPLSSSEGSTSWMISGLLAWRSESWKPFGYSCASSGWLARISSEVGRSVGLINESTTSVFGAEPSFTMISTGIQLALLPRGPMAGGEIHQKRVRIVSHPNSPVRASSMPSRAPVLVARMMYTEPISTATPTDTTRMPRMPGLNARPAKRFTVASMGFTGSARRRPRRRSDQ